MKSCLQKAVPCDIAVSRISRATRLNYCDKRPFLHYLEDALSVWTNLGKYLLFVWLCVFSIKTGTIRIMRLDELSSVVRRSRRKMEDSSSRRMCLVPVFILETHNQTNNECLPKFVQTDNASSSVKTAKVKACKN